MPIRKVKKISKKLIYRPLAFNIFKKIMKRDMEFYPGVFANIKIFNFSDLRIIHFYDHQNFFKTENYSKYLL